MALHIRTIYGRLYDRMLNHAILIMEILSFVSCINWVYGRRIKFDIGTIITSLLILASLEIMNQLQLSGWSSLITHLLILLYCKFEFKQSYIKTIINWILFVIFLTAIQFLVMFVVGNVITGDIVCRNVVVNVIVLFICMFILPAVDIKCFKERRNKVSNYNRVIFCIVTGVIVLLLFQVKQYGYVNIQFFILAIPLAVVLLIMLGTCNRAEIKVEYLKREMDITRDMQGHYTDLLNSVRLRQHEFKNHLAAIFSAHYTYKTYENLVNAQNEYCNKLMAENRYNNLLLLGNRVLSGFLYGKFVEIEEDGIKINYSINSKMDNCLVPDYNLIEMLGILLDNAVETIKETNKETNKVGTINVSFSESNDKYIFVIQNESDYKSYSDIEKMFEMGTSSKGIGRGLGLYHIKNICKELDCSICCRNIIEDECNWIEFALEMGKADRD